MSSEQRLDRLERIAKLFVRAGLRARCDVRNLDEKMAALVGAQLLTEERFLQLEDKMEIMLKGQIRTDERFARFEETMTRSDERFARFEVQTDRTLKALLDIVRKRNENSADNSRN